MKTTTQFLKLTLLLIALFGFSKMHAQGCLPNFVFNVNSNGSVSFTSTSVGVNSITTQYYWSFPGGSPSTYTGTGGAGMIASTSYSNAGTYTVSLFILTVPSCSSQITYTLAVTNPSPNCSLSIGTTPATGTATCNGSATVTNVTGLCGAPSYTWFPGGMTGASVTGLCPGTVYTVIASGGTGTNCCASVMNSASVAPTNTCNLFPSFSFVPGPNGQAFYYSTAFGTNSLSTYSWNFGNGQTANGFSTVTTYTSNGIYTVSYSVYVSPTCTGNVVSTITITNVGGNPCNLNANFQYTIGANGQVNFFNSSTGVVSPFTTLWTFGNGQQSTTNNASVTYTANGSYPVMLLVVNTNTSMPLCMDSITQIITINNIPTPCNLSASFNHSSGANGLVNFVSTSTGTIAGTVYFWNFGDGTTGFGVNPSHTYPSSGSYFVLMTAINNSVNCMSTASTGINVSGINCVANSNFSVSPTNTAQVWTAMPAFPWNVSAAVWSWGDGSSSNGLYTSHTYSAAGNYQICLSVTVNCSSTSSTCATYSISKMSAANAMVQINVIPPQLTEVGIAETLFVNELKFYPNPNQGLLNIELRSENNAPINLHIIDLNGKAVFTSSLNTGYEEINLGHLSNGVYILQLEQAGQHLNKKLIISRD